MQETNYSQQRIELSSKRKLGIAEYGDLEGEVILYFHGTPGSRLDARCFHELALKLNCRLIAIDRPGMGLSDFDPHSTILSWADDINELTDILAIKNFAIIAHSGGTPFAAACAHQLTEKVNSIALVSGIAPCDHPRFTSGMSFNQIIPSKIVPLMPKLAKFMMKATQSLLTKPNQLTKQISKRLPKIDQDLFQDEESKNQIIDAALEAFKQGLDGPAHEMVLLFRPWNFDLSKIQCPTTIWHATLDTQSPFSHAKIYETLIADAELMVIEGQGHLSLVRNCFADIVKGQSCGFADSMKYGAQI